MTGALGDGAGKWRLRVTAERPIRVMSLLQSVDGSLTNVSTAPERAVHRRAASSVCGAPASRRPCAGRQPLRGSGGRCPSQPSTTPGMDYGPLTLRIGANEAVHITSADLEGGNPGKGLSGGVGEGEGDWRLELTTELDLEVLSYARTWGGGTLASLHDVVPEDEAVHRVAFFNPASNRGRVSWLRLVKPGQGRRRRCASAASTTRAKRGRAKWSSPSGAGASRSLSAQALESGEGEGMTGALGDGAGKWRLRVTADRPLRVMSLLASGPDLTNLSTVPASVMNQGAQGE